MKKDQPTFQEIIDEFKNLIAERQAMYQKHLEDLRLQNQEIENHYSELLKQKDGHISTLMHHLQITSAGIKSGEKPSSPQSSLPDNDFDQVEEDRAIKLAVQEMITNVIRENYNDDSPDNSPSTVPDTDIQTAAGKDGLDEEFELPEAEPSTDSSARFQQILVHELRLIRKDLPGLFLNFFMNLADLNLYVELNPTHWKSFDIDEKKDTVGMVQNVYEKAAESCAIHLENCEIRFMDPSGETLARFRDDRMSIIDQ